MARTRPRTWSSPRLSHSTSLPTSLHFLPPSSTLAHLHFTLAPLACFRFPLSPLFFRLAWSLVTVAIAFLKKFREVTLPRAIKTPPHWIKKMVKPLDTLRVWTIIEFLYIYSIIIFLHVCVVIKTKNVMLTKEKDIAVTSHFTYVNLGIIRQAWNSIRAIT